MQVDISGITRLTKDRATSIRLYRGYKKRHHGQSPEWVVQKIIRDLEREREVVGKTQPVRTRGGQKARKTTNKNKEFYWYRGVSIERGSWADRNRGLVVFGFFVALTTGRLLSNGGFDFSSTQQLESFNTLEAPALLERVDNGSVLTIQNEVPETVTVTLNSLESETTYSFTIPAYPGGRYYSDSASLPEECSDDAPFHSISVEPGVYEATMSYLGTTRTGAGNWIMVEGWEQFGCYYSVYNDNDNYQ
ncbi:hypothetical protein N836_34070 [Leptolyngbya sp. Heron Island J]|uniref:hypothetical protein n=1 Tax=Leptolyngbya sp. Heron Island J TaxID=1385935 RepID=UPI0003B97B5F|nr:hypothetical protein [Leptolyngbya sp. Heron Island J]ESA38106.1 hypothetical protein N836_34070 [Leptolyngbya sp. Heron Island J]